MVSNVKKIVKETYSFKVYNLIGINSTREVAHEAKWYTGACYEHKLLAQCCLPNSCTTVFLNSYATTFLTLVLPSQLSYHWTFILADLYHS
jgi:hypothetical protein